jgi:AcrR family transcriptional regulator
MNLQPGPHRRDPPAQKGTNVRAILSLVKGDRTKTVVTRAALELVSEVGLGGLTIATLADRVSMSKSGVFAHFASKEALQIEVLGAARDLARQAVFDAAKNRDGGLAQLVEFFQLWTGWATRSGLPGGCPFVAAVFEFDDLDGPVRDTLSAIQFEFFVRVTDLVRDAVASGELRADTDIDQVVWETVAIYNGHHVAQRFVRDPSADVRAQTAFNSLIERCRVQS